MAVERAITGAYAPGLLIFDQNQATRRVAAAALRLSGYRVFSAHSREDAADLCREHGPGGDARMTAVLLDAAADAEEAARVLQVLGQIPGAESLPVMLLVSRRNPTPLQGAEALPRLRRPFSPPDLVDFVRDTLSDYTARTGRAVPNPLARRLGELLSDHFPKQTFDAPTLAKLASAMSSEAFVPRLATGVTLTAKLGAQKLENLLEMLATAGETGTLAVHRADAWARLHLDRGRIRLAEVQGTEEDLKLGRFIVEAGFVAEEDLETELVDKEAGVPMGTHLVQRKILRSSDLAAALAAQAREVTCNLLTWDSGTLSFTPTDDVHPLSEGTEHELWVTEALLDGLRRLDQSAVMGPHMAGINDVYIRNDEQLQRLGRNLLAREELAVIELLNGRHTVKEVARRTRTGGFTVARILYRLSKANLVRRRVQPFHV